MQYPSAHKELLIARELEAARAELMSMRVRSVQVTAALAHLRRHLFDPELNVATLRRDCRIRNHNLTTAFQVEFGSCLRMFIERERIAAAKRLLFYPQIEVWRVAHAVGFATVETFCRAFKRQTGATASEYREALEATVSGSHAALGGPARAEPALRASSGT